MNQTSTKPTPVIRRNDGIIELSHVMQPDKGFFPVKADTYDVTTRMPEVRHRPDIWYVLSDLSFNSHAGTHIEVPFHHLKEGMDISQYPVANLIGPMVVLDFHDKKDGEKITLDEIKAAAEGRVRKGDIIFLRTDMDAHFWTDRWMEQPYLEEAATDYLLGFDPPVIGTDAAGFEVPGTDYQPNHQKLFNRNVAQIESLTNLAAVGDQRMTVFILPLMIPGVDACPCRIVAIKKGALDHV